MTQALYDPRMEALIDQCEADWGNPEGNRARLIPYGINLIDQALYGLDPEGELILIQGPQKKRKTTLLINIIINIMLNARPVVKPWINIDVLESGMPPKKYRDAILSNVASRILISWGHKAHGYCDVCHNEFCQELQLSPKVLRYKARSSQQMEAIKEAQAITRPWPLLIHGPRIDQGNTRNLMAAAVGGKEKPARWKQLIEQYGVSIFAADHLQQFAMGKAMEDYEKQVAVVPVVSDFVATNSVAFLLISQVSLGSLRESKQNGTTLTAAGGAKAAQEANTVLSVDYNHDGIMQVKIEESRDADNISVYQPMDDNSGAFYGLATADPQF